MLVIWLQDWSATSLALSSEQANIASPIATGWTVELTTFRHIETPIVKVEKNIYNEIKIDYNQSYYNETWGLLDIHR